MQKYSGELFAIFGEMENSQTEGPMGKGRDRGKEDMVNEVEEKL